MDIAIPFEISSEIKKPEYKAETNIGVDLGTYCSGK